MESKLSVGDVVCYMKDNTLHEVVAIDDKFITVVDVFGNPTKHEIVNGKVLAMSFVYNMLPYSESIKRGNIYEVDGEQVIVLKVSQLGVVCAKGVSVVVIDQFTLLGEDVKVGDVVERIGMCELFEVLAVNGETVKITDGFGKVCSIHKSKLNPVELEKDDYDDGVDVTIGSLWVWGDLLVEVKRVSQLGVHYIPVNSKSVNKTLCSMSFFTSQFTKLSEFEYSVGDTVFFDGSRFDIIQAVRKEGIPKSYKLLKDNKHYILDKKFVEEFFSQQMFSEL